MCHRNYGSLQVASWWRTTWLTKTRRMLSLVLLCLKMTLTSCQHQEERYPFSTWWHSRSHIKLFSFKFLSLYFYSITRVKVNTQFLLECRQWRLSWLPHQQQRFLHSILKITISLLLAWMILQFKYITFVWMRYDRHLIQAKTFFCHLFEQKKVSACLFIVNSLSIV